METKLCSKCQNELPTTDFDTRSNGNLSGRCKSCRREYMREYGRKRSSEPEYRLKRQSAKKKYRSSKKGQRSDREYRERYRSDPEKIQLEREYGKEYYYANKDDRLQVAKEWVKKHPERANENNRRAWLKRSQDPVRALGDRIRHSIKRTLKRKNFVKSACTFILLGYGPKEAYEHLSKYLSKPCEVCGEVVIAIKCCHMDHIVPLCKAESFDDVIRLNQLNNLRLICGPCNMKKSSSIERNEDECA